MQPLTPAILLLTIPGIVYSATPTPTPAWMRDREAFCKELAKRSNGTTQAVPFGPPVLAQFETGP
jgi:hypothetical protein